MGLGPNPVFDAADAPGAPIADDPAGASVLARVSSRGILLHGEVDADNKQPAPECCWYPDM
jgi:hypothetical protein